MGLLFTNRVNIGTCLYWKITSPRRLERIATPIIQAACYPMPVTMIAKAATAMVLTTPEKSGYMGQIHLSWTAMVMAGGVNREITASILITQ